MICLGEAISDTFPDTEPAYFSFEGCATITSSAGTEVFLDVLVEAT